MKIGLREANLHFSKYIEQVRNGEQIVLTERGEPIALLKPVKSRSGVLQDRLEILEKRGLLRRPTKSGFRIPRGVRIQGRPLSQYVSADRDQF